MVRKYTLLFSAVLLCGIIAGVSFNYAINQKPSPISINAANPTPTPTKTPTPTPTNSPTPTPIPTFSINGFVYIDTNANGNHVATDSNYTAGATISAMLNGVPKGSVQSVNTGKFTIAGLFPGSYTITISAPDGYRTTTDNPETVILGNTNTNGIRFGIIPTLWNIPSSEKFVMCRDLHQFVRDHCN